MRLKWLLEEGGGPIFESYDISLEKTQLVEPYLCMLALFPGSPLALTKKKNRGGEPGSDSHMISWHNDITAIIAKVVTPLCSHVIG